MTPQNALRLSVAAALVTIALKWGAWWATGSVAFLSEALDSIVNLAGASFALAMVSYARRPADSAHPYGYGKAEYFSSALEGTLIMTAAAGIFVVVAERIEQPQPLESLGSGTGLAVAAATMNFVVARVLTRAGKVHRSLATEADGQHLMADVWMTAGVVAGVGAAGLTGWVWLDPAVAILVAVNLVREGWHLVSFSLRGLMDAAWPHEDIQRASKRFGCWSPRAARSRTSARGAPARDASLSWNCTCIQSGASNAQMRSRRLQSVPRRSTVSSSSCG